MPEKRGMVFIIAGAVLILSALSLFLYNRYENLQVGQEAENLLDDLQTIISENPSPAATFPAAPEPEKGVSDETAPQETPDPEMPVIVMDGYEYVGVLSLPKPEQMLPVMAEWDAARLKIAPCRQFGSSRTDDLVIAAHNYKNLFGSLSKPETGDTVIFTDVDGIENHYEVDHLDILAPTEVEAVQNSGYDLVLYTCTYEAKNRVTVFCNRQEEAVEDTTGGVDID